MSNSDNKPVGPTANPCEPSLGGTPLGPEFPGRRSFIAVLIGIGGAAVGAVLSVPIVRFVLFPLFRRTTETGWSDAGDEAQFAASTEPTTAILTVQQRDGWRVVLSRKPVYVLPPGKARHRVLSPVCPHLGCLVEWNGTQKEFFCPCHDSVFGPEGSWIEGPAPRGLDYLDSKVENGRRMVRYEHFRKLVPDREVIG